MAVPFFGDYDLTETVNLPFNTFSSDDPSASVTITNLAGGDIKVYQDGTVGTPTGITVSIDNGTTGTHFAILDLTDTNDAGFYANGSRYAVRMEGTTVDGATINAWIGAFSIGCTLRPTTAGRTLDVQTTGEVDANMTMILGHLLTQTGTQLADGFEKFFNVGTPTGTVNSLADAVPGAAGGGFIAGTNAETTVTTAINANLIGNITGNLSGSVGSVSALAANVITAASINADAITNAKIANDAIAAENLKTGALSADAFAADAIVAATFATDAITSDALAASALTEIQSSCNSALVANNLDHLALTACDSNNITNVVADETILACLLAADGDISAYNDNNHSLEAMRVRGDSAWTTATTVSITNLADASAGKLDDILDGTGGTGLTVNKFTIDANNSDGGLFIDNDGGPAINAVGTTYGIYCEAEAAAGYAAYFTASNGAAGGGFYAGSASYGGVFSGTTADVLLNSSSTIEDGSANNVTQVGAQAALVANNLDHLCKTAVNSNADMTTEITDGTILSNLMSASSDTSTFVVADDSLQGISEGAAGGGATAAQVWAYGTRVLTASTNFNDPSLANIVDGVWDELSTGHTGAGKAGAQLWTDIDAILVDTSTSIPADVANITTVTVSTTTVGEAPVVDIVEYQNCAIYKQIAVTTAQTGDDHALIASLPATPTVAAFTIPTGAITVGGDGDKTLTISQDDTNTATAGIWHYKLHNTTDDFVVAEGSFTVKPTPIT